MSDKGKTSINAQQINVFQMWKHLCMRDIGCWDFTEELGYFLATMQKGQSSSYINNPIKDTKDP